MSTPAPIRIGLYARISHADDELGVDRQIREIRRDLPEFRGLKGEQYVIVDEYVDNDVSAYDITKVRPEFERLQNDVKSGRVNSIVVWEFDRLYRQPLDFEILLRLMETVDARLVISMTGEHVDLGTGEGLDMARIKGTLGASEVRKMKRRIRAKHLELAEAGLPSGGTRRFGYEDGHMSVNEDEALIIKEMATRVLAGEKLSALARELNERGIPTAQSLVVAKDGTIGPQYRWRATNLRRSLIGKHVAGIRTHHGKEYPAKWPAILDMQTHEALVRLLSDPSRRNNPGGPTKYPLTGFMECGLCGGKMYVRTTKWGPKWTCTPAAGGCGRIGRQTRMEDWVYEMLFSAIENPALHRGMADADTATAAERRAEAIADLTFQQEQRKVTMAAYFTPERGAPRMSKDEYDFLIGRIDARIKELQRVIRTLSIGSAPIPWEMIENGTLRQQWATLPLAQQRGVLGLYIESVRVLPIGKGTRPTPDNCFEMTWAA